MQTKRETRFFLEKKHAPTDLPLIDTAMQSISNYWLIIIATTIIFYTQVATNFIKPANPILLGLVGLYQIVGPLTLFLLLFRFVGKQPLRSLYRSFSLADLGLVGLFTIINLAYGYFASTIIPSVNNKAITASTGHGSMAKKVVDFIINAVLNVPALMIEELFGIILFLAVAAMLKNYFHQGRNASMWTSLIISMIAFGLMHFYVYNWHLAQMLLIIGISRLFTTGIYIRTRSIWPAFLIHWLTDTFISVVATFMV